jgi:hypothetical protein
MAVSMEYLWVTAEQVNSSGGGLITNRFEIRNKNMNNTNSLFHL